MNISLRPELEKFIDEKVRSGRYRSAEEAVNKAVELLKEREEAENRLEQLLQEAEDSGPATEMTPQDWVEIEHEGLRRLKSQKSALLRGARSQAFLRHAGFDDPRIRYPK